jgi:hypothetical protein
MNTKQNIPKSGNIAQLRVTPAARIEIEIGIGIRIYALNGIL